MKKPLKITLISLFAIAAILLITGWILSQTYVMPVSSERTKIFNRGDIDDVREYLRQPDNGVEMDNYYALINRNRADIMEVMFKEFKLDPDYGFKYEYATPLFGAAKEFKPEAVRILIKFGADVNYKNPYGMTPLIATSYTTFERENSASLEITKMLVEAGADVNVMTKYGESAIGGALAGFQDNLDRAKYLVESGADLSVISFTGSNYLFYCSTIECVEYFVSKGLDINSTANDGRSILQSSLAVKSNMDFTKQLLGRGADICHKDNAGDTVLNHVERQNTGPHDKKENPEYYNKKVTENKASETYQYLEKEYNTMCLESLESDNE